MCSLSPSGRAQRAQGARGRCGSAPVWEAAAKLCSVAPVASERVAGVPSLTVRAAGGLVGGVPACLAVAPSPRPVVELPSEAPALPCSAPSTGVTQGRHGGRKGRLTAVTQVFYNTCVTV